MNETQKDWQLLHRFDLMQSIYIREATAADVDALRDIGAGTFTETFASFNTAENMEKYLSESFSVEKVREELSKPNAVFYLAETNNITIGYLKLNFGAAQTELKDETAVEIERIYVLKAYHGRQVGQLLYNKAIEVARANKAEYVWLGVWEKNERAINFYKKNGFTEFHKHIFKLGDDEQTDIMMKRLL